MAQNNETLPFATLIHMITIKLSSKNYLLWRSQITPILACQNLLGFVDGSKSAPSITNTNTTGQSVPNPAYETWRIQDQRLLSLILSSLTEESMAEVIGCSTSRAVWLSLEAAFSHSSKSRELRLKDDLQLMKKGSRSVAEYGRLFKSLCDQLAAIGRPVDDTDKAHWFLRGLGSSFSSFSAAQMALTPLPTFCDLLSKAESFSLFQESLEHAGTSPVAFYGHRDTRGTQRSGALPSNRGRGNQTTSSRGRGRGNTRRIPRCQICRQEGHYANTCDQRYAHNPSANLVEAFSAVCSVS